MLSVLTTLTAAQAGLSACVPGGGHDHYPFCDTTLSIDERVKDIVARIHDEAQIGMSAQDVTNTRFVYLYVFLGWKSARDSRPSTFRDTSAAAPLLRRPHG